MNDKELDNLSSPVRMRTVFNSFFRSMLLYQNYNRVLNLGCGHDIDREGSYYSDYFTGADVVKVDKKTVVQYYPHERKFLELYGYTFDKTLKGPFNIEYNVDVIASAESLPFESDSFDFIFCGFAYHEMDVYRVSFELYRVLKIGGKLFVSYCKPGRMSKCKALLTSTFCELGFIRLQLQESLDGRSGFAEAFYGEKI